MIQDRALEKSLRRRIIIKAALPETLATCMLLLGITPAVITLTLAPKQTVQLVQYKESRI